MELTEAIRNRRSIRGFRPEPVPQDTLRRVLELSRRNHLLLSSDKFDKSGIFRIAPLSRIDRLISDAPSPGYFYGRSLKFESPSRNDGRDGRER